MSEPVSESDSQSGDDLLAELADDFLRRYRAGDQPSVEQYEKLHPDLAERIRNVFPAMVVMEERAAGATVDFGPPTERVGATIGRYKLLERIGEGGFGIVYMAEQQEPIRRKAALKVIKPGLDTHQVIARFEAERQALALMDHDNIAKVLDAGATESGRPYFVMELVYGVPITEFCDKNCLSTRARLELFVQVCRAVQHAHTKGIIHRDIKPTNVLVTLNEGVAVPKVIDFGIAKAMGKQLTDKTLFTNFAELIGTPLYMSPEQAEMTGIDVDTRSDVYSLGVMLYELLTGTTPVEKERLKQAAFDEVRRIIREEEPPRPSTRLSTMGEQARSISAAQRKSDPKQLGRLMRGELDWIVMKSLEKERKRRYETANGLARDIERFLHNEAVEACPPSALYRLRKLVLRNRAALATATILATVLLAGTVVSTWQAIRATQAEQLADDRLNAESEARAAEARQRRVAEEQRHEAEIQRAEAEANFQKARQAVDEYFTVVSESKLLDVPGLQSLRRDLLEAALRFYQESANQRSDDPDVLANLAVTYLRVAEIYVATNRVDDAVATVEQALDVIDQLRREFPTASSSHRKLAGFWNGLRTTTVGANGPHDPKRAIRMLLRLAETWESLMNEYPSVVEFRNDMAAIDRHIADVLTTARQESDAAAYLLKAQAIWEKLVSDEPTVPEYKADLAAVFYTLAMKNGNAGRNDDADTFFRKNLTLLEELAAEYPQSPQYRCDLAWTLARASGRFATGPHDEEAADRRAVEIDFQLVRDFPGVTLYQENFVIHTGILADCLASTRGADESLAYLRKAVPLVVEYAVDANKTVNGRGALVDLYGTYGTLLWKSNCADEAADALATLCHLNIKLADDFPDDPIPRNRLVQNYIELAEVLNSQSKIGEAEATFQQGIQTYDELIAAHPAAPDLQRLRALLQARLARFQSLTDQNDAASQTIDTAIDSHRKIIEQFPEYEGLGMVYLNLAILLVAADQSEPAEAAYKKGAELIGKNSYLLNNYAWRFSTSPETRFHQARWAVELARTAVELAPDNGANFNTLAAALYRAGDWQDAVEALEKSLELRNGGDAFDWLFLAMAEWRLDNKDAAREWYEKAVEWTVKNAPTDLELLRFRAEAAELLEITENQ